MLGLKFSNSASKLLKKCDNELYRRIMKKIRELIANPYPNESSKIEGRKDNSQRIRVGSYRIIYIVKKENNENLKYYIDKHVSDYEWEGFLEKAFRGLATEDEFSRYSALFHEGIDSGIPFDLAIQLPVVAALASPSFLFRNETFLDEVQIQPVSSLDMASRLSYFLWSSAPDAAVPRKTG